jgi:hypothetical protein
MGEHCKSHERLIISARLFMILIPGLLIEVRNYGNYHGLLITVFPHSCSFSPLPAKFTEGGFWNDSLY